jgi:hypothetical protein
MPGLHVELSDRESRALSLLAVKHSPSATKTELIKAMIMAAAMSDPDVSTWLTAFPAPATADAREPITA